MKTMFKKRWYLFVPLIIAAIIAFVFFTMYLWNWLMPLIFHLPEITFWQTIGLMLLSRFILGCGGPRGRGGHRGHRGPHCRQHLHKKWGHMTPEEREKFRERIHMYHAPWNDNCCGDNKGKES